MTPNGGKAGAMVLAAGLGSRLRPLTTELPKPCVPFLNEPLLFRSLRVLGELGFDDVVVNTAYQSDVMKSMCAKAPGDLPSIILSVEEERLGTAGGVANAAHHFRENEPVLILNGDVVSGMDLSRLLEAHMSSDAWATLAVFRNPAFPDALHKVAYDAESRVESVAGVTTASTDVTTPVARAIYTGTMVMSPGFIKELPSGVEACLKEDGFWPGLRSGKDIRVVEIPGYWSDIGTPVRYIETHKEWILDESFKPTAGFQEVAPHCYVHETAVLEPGVNLTGPVLVGARTHVGAGATLSGVVCLGEGCVVPRDTSLQNVIAWSHQCVPEGRHEWTVFWSQGKLQVQ